MVDKYDNYELRKVTSLENTPGTVKDGDGYIWDPSGLPDNDFDVSKVPLEYRRLATWMRSKLFGKDVRETIARFVELSGVIDDRQKSVESFLVDFIQAATEYEINSGPEIVQARGGKATLGQRLDEATAQLAQTEIKKADKTHIWPMENMGQDVKEAMTGGSVAVVGKNTILSENIVNGQVIPSKTSFAKRINLFSGDYTNFAIAGDAHNIVTSGINQRSALVRVDAGKTYTIAVGATRDTFRVGLLYREPQIGDVTKRTFSNVKSPYTLSVGDGEVYMIVTVSMKYNQPVMTVIEGNTPLPLERANTVSIDLYELESIMTKENENWSVI